MYKLNGCIVELPTIPQWTTDVFKPTRNMFILYNNKIFKSYIIYE